ncbi:NAD(P)/FAD-dependent oxidoreductase [Sulfurimonas sp.]|uniref:NAD(P)/FAD-dependent oxidoreductase n=1 Tax=Sulfurimonas sp. TaxID=2022749 RepID=UPI0035625EBC
MIKVAVVGAGYGGLRAIEHLVGNEQVSLYLFDENSYHYLQTEAYGYIAGRFDLHDVALDLNNWCHGFKYPITFIKEKVEYINSSKRSIQTASSTYDYDYLIIATGARTNFFSFIDGMDKYGYGVKKLFRSHSFRTSFEHLLYEKLENPSIQGQTINLAIGGAGLSGVEIAAEMSDVIKRHTKSIGESAKEIKVYLIDASETILPGMSPYIIENTKNRLNDLGINIMTKSFIERVDLDTVYFKDGRKLDYTFMIFTGGILANTIECDINPSLNRTNQYICDTTLRIEKNIFVIGDCCEIKDKKQNILPPTAQIAEKSAEYAASSIEKLIQNKEIQPFSANVDGIFVALGGKYAVGELFSYIKVKGYLAYYLKKLITKSYYIGLKFRLNTGFKKRTMSEGEE